MSKRRVDWNEEHVALLKKLWTEGLSGSQVAARIPGATRSAVLGKIHRLDMPLRQPRIGMGRPRERRKPRPYIPRRARAKAAPPNMRPSRLPPPPPFDIEEPVSLNVSLMALTDFMCRWPVGDPRDNDFHFCGHRIFNGFSYCEYHTRVAYQPHDQAVARQRQAEKALAA